MTAQRNMINSSTVPIFSLPAGGYCVQNEGSRGLLRIWSRVNDIDESPEQRL